LHNGKFPGKPDLILKKHGAIIFIHGCFWHGHSCRFFVWPKSNTEYWQKKIRGNIERDKRTHTLLREQGWRVFIVWECELNKERQETVLLKLTEDIRNNQGSNTQQMDS